MAAMVIPFPDHPCTLSASLAVRLYCLRFAFALQLHQCGQAADGFAQDTIALIIEDWQKNSERMSIGAHPERRLDDGRQIAWPASTRYGTSHSTRHPAKGKSA